MGVQGVLWQVAGGWGPGWTGFYSLSLFALDSAMQLSDARSWALLLLTDSAFLWLLRQTPAALLLGGLGGLWLEGALRLAGLWGLLRLRGPLGLLGSLPPLLCLQTPLFVSLRTLAGGSLGAPPLRVAEASWPWLLLGYGAAGLGWAVWAVLSPPGAPKEREPGQENNRDLMWRLLKLSRPDLPFLLAALLFLVLAVLGESPTGLGVGGGKPQEPAQSHPHLCLCRGDTDPSLFWTRD